MGSHAEGQAHIRGFDSFELRLGDELRGERATLGKSLLDVQRELRIKAAYIAAIENCDLEVFPNRGFIAGYVRSYARYLGLDPESVFARFCHEAGFDGVNAGMTGSKRSASGRIVASGPVVAHQNDPVLKPLRPAAELKPGLSDRMSLSAFGSLAVLVSLISGLGYAGFAVLENIQRVEIAPVDQRPDALSEMAEFVGPGEPVATVQLVDVIEAAPSRAADMDLARLYQPRELDVPVLDSRDGPIVDINPDNAGLLAASPAPVDETQVAALIQGLQEPGFGQEPIVREEVGVPKVNIVAQRPAWIRVYQADGTVLFEKILESGEVYTLPQDVEAPLIRAGNAGSVFVAINRETFGPLGSGTGVIKNISLLPDDIMASYTPADAVPEVVLATVSALDLADATE